MNPRFDHVGITVTDLPAATAFFVGLGLVPDGESTLVEGAFLDTVHGSQGASVEVVTLRGPDGGSGFELSAFRSATGAPEPTFVPPSHAGLRNVCLEVDDLRTTVSRLADEGHELVGGVGEWEGVYLLAYVRGPDQIIVSLAERIG